jgi:hypothetical protein
MAMGKWEGKKEMIDILAMFGIVFTILFIGLIVYGIYELINMR